MHCSFKKLPFSEILFAFVKWFLLSLVVGAICGASGGVFHHLIDFGAGLFSEYSMLVWALPAAGLATAGLYHLCRVELNVGTDAVFSAVNDKGIVPALLVPLIFICTVLTHLCGGSAGREGAALQFGGAVANKFGRIIKLNEKDIKIMTICGMAGMFAAVFATPLTAAVFCMEVVSVGVFYFSAFVPSLVSAVTAYLIASFFSVSPLSFVLPAINADVWLYLKTILLAIACAVISIVFCRLIRYTHKLFSKYIKNRYLRIASGGLIIAILTTLIGTTDYNGSGTSIIAQAMSGQARPEAFVLKMIFTALTVGVGFKGGEIVPTFFVGSTFGCFFGGLIGIDPALGAAIGMIATFCGVTNAPIASIFMGAEIFGGDKILLFAVASAVSFLFSGYFGLYGAQRIVYSKTDTECINRLTNEKEVKNMGKFIIATKNKSKLIELERILAPLGIKAVTASDLGIELDEVEETGTTFSENAYLKAYSACKATGLPAVADDSGICVDALDGCPGIFSARYGGEGLDDEGRTALLLSELEGIPDEKRTAKYVAAVCCLFPDGRRIDVVGECHGTIGYTPVGDGGFGYDPVFIVDGMTCAQMSPEQKDKISHRSKALQKLSEQLKKMSLN